MSDLEIPGSPSGFAPIHLLAPGKDKNKQRPNLMSQLIERKVDIEAQTKKYPRNTTCTLAASQGCGTVWDTLSHAGADVKAKNAHGLGQLQGGRQ